MVDDSVGPEAAGGFTSIVFQVRGAASVLREMEAYAVKGIPLGNPGATVCQGCLLLTCLFSLRSGRIIRIFVSTNRNKRSETQHYLKKSVRLHRIMAVSLLTFSRVFLGESLAALEMCLPRPTSLKPRCKNYYTSPEYFCLACRRAAFFGADYFSSKIHFFL